VKVSRKTGLREIKRRMEQSGFCNTCHPYLSFTIRETSGKKKKWIDPDN